MFFVFTISFIETEEVIRQSDFCVTLALKMLIYAG